MGVWEWIKSFFSPSASGTSAPDASGGSAGGVFSHLFSGTNGFTKIVMLVIFLGVAVFLIFEGIQLFATYQNQMFKFAILEKIGGLVEKGFDKVLDGAEEAGDDVKDDVEGAGDKVKEEVDKEDEGLEDKLGEDE